MLNGRYTVYILADVERQQLVTGLTSVIREHVWQQKQRSENGPVNGSADQLVLYEVFDDPALAVARFDELQAFDRDALISVVRRDNPGWRDLSDGWFEKASCE